MCDTSTSDLRDWLTSLVLYQIFIVKARYLNIAQTLAKITK